MAHIPLCTKQEVIGESRHPLSARQALLAREPWTAQAPGRGGDTGEGSPAVRAPGRGCIGSAPKGVARQASAAHPSLCLLEETHPE